MNTIPQMNVLSLGAGVQSTTVLLMSCLGELPKLDHAIFADTGWEPGAVYTHLDWLQDYAEHAGVAVHRVTAGDLRSDALRSDALRSQVRGVKSEGHRWASMPMFTLQPDGSKGMINRQCTKEYKIEPIQKAVRSLLGYQPRQRIPPASVRQWFGISFDELQRMRVPHAKWQEFYYPLVDMRMSRAGCLEWLASHGFPAAPRSACIGCPFHSDHEWRQIKADPVLWADAVEFDRAIRNCGGMRGQMFLHRSCKALEEVDLRTDFDKGQLPLWQDECSGHCGV